LAYRIEFTPRADSECRGLGQSVQRRLGQRIDSLADHPRPHSVKQLAGEGDFYRARVGDYRIVYQICDKSLLVVIVRLARISHQGGNNEGQQAQKDENGSEMEESVPWRGEN